jgi:hypothetical protein
MKSDKVDEKVTKRPISTPGAYPKGAFIALF